MTDDNLLEKSPYKEHEYELIKKFLIDADFLQAYYRVIPIEAFSKLNSRIMGIVFKYYSEQNTPIKCHILKAKIHEASFEEAEEMSELVDDIFNDDEEPLQDSIEVCLRHIIVNYIRSELEKIEDKYTKKDNVEGWIEGLDSISKKSVEMKSNMNISDDLVDFADTFNEWAEERIALKQENRNFGMIPTGVEELDRWIPTKRGTVNSFLGRTKVGKSIILSNLAFGAYQKGYEVLIVILENSEFQVLNRLYSRAGFVNYKKLQRWNFSNEEDIEIRRRMECYGDNMNKLWIYKGVQYETNAADIENKLRILFERHGCKIDLLIADYAQILGSVRMPDTKDAQDWKKHEQVMWELKNIATNFKYEKGKGDNIAVWTALQTNRGSWERESGRGGEERELRDVSVFDISGGYNVIPALDNLVFINQNYAEKEDGILRLTPSIARDDASSDSHIQLETAYEHMMINRIDTEFSWKQDGHEAELLI